MLINQRTKGFTIIELLVTVVIVAILASGALPIFQLTVQRAKESELRISLRQIREAIDAYKKAVDEGKIAKTITQTGYPPNLEVLSQGVVDITSPKKAKIKFLRHLPRDPMAESGDMPAAETWGVRSYESDEDSPRQGADVYDVYSLSAQPGINGVPYKQW